MFTVRFVTIIGLLFTQLVFGQTVITIPAGSTSYSCAIQFEDSKVEHYLTPWTVRYTDFQFFTYDNKRDGDSRVSNHTDLDTQARYLRVTVGKSLPKENLLISEVEVYGR